MPRLRKSGDVPPPPTCLHSMHKDSTHVSKADISVTVTISCNGDRKNYIITGLNTLYIFIYIYICIYMYTYTHTHTHTYIYIYIRR